MPLLQLMLLRKLLPTQRLLRLQLTLPQLKRHLSLPMRLTSKLLLSKWPQL
jgi:hypothetical protein